MSQTSAIQRLQTLPPLFRGGDLTVRFQWTSKTASQYLYLWKQRGLVEALGGHSDVYANKLLVTTPNWEQALLDAMPSALVIGIEALRRAGWTTQIPSRPTVAVAKDGPAYSIDRFDISRRPRNWFERTRPGVIAHGSEALPVLSPAWALADMLHRAGDEWSGTGLGPDDIEWDEVNLNHEADWEQAIDKLGAHSLPPLAHLNEQ